MSACRSASCGAEIIWATHHPIGQEIGKKIMPVDVASLDSPNANLEVWRDRSGNFRFRYLKEGERDLPLQKGHHRGISHYAVCPEAAAWRKSKRSSA